MPGEYGDSLKTFSADRRFPGTCLGDYSRSALWDLFCSPGRCIVRGHAKDDPVRLRAAADYVERHVLSR